MKKFEDLNINSRIVDSLYNRGFKNPTDVQSAGINLIASGKNAIIISETGTGKTLTYLIPLIEKIDSVSKDLQAIILAPTYELIMQIQKELEYLLSTSEFEIRTLPIIGKANIVRQIDSLKKKPHIVIGSAGRIGELLKRKKIKMHCVRTIILDEFDRLLDKHNLEQTDVVLKSKIKSCQSIGISATFPKHTQEMAIQKIPNYELLTINSSKVLSENISHKYIVVNDKREKLISLRSLIHTNNSLKGLIFVKEKEKLRIYNEKLKFHHVDVEAIHGEMPRFERIKIFRDFQNGKYKFLITTDMLSRGLDFSDINYVINLDIPQTIKIYKHRGGRTARAGKKGVIISFVVSSEVNFLKKIASRHKFNLEEIKKTDKI